jgi:hypothetical protein
MPLVVLAALLNSLLRLLEEVFSPSYGKPSPKQKKTKNPRNNPYRSIA